MNLAIVVDNKPACDPLEVLNAERRGFQAELARQANARARLGEVTLAENEALAALNECSGTETAAMSAWVQTGCAGDPPQPQTEARRKLTASLASASAHAAAARAAIGDVEAQQRELAARLAAVTSSIEFHVGEILVRECETAFGELQKIANEINIKIAKAQGLREWIVEAGRAAQSRGDIETASRFFRLGERCATFPRPEFGATRTDTLQASERWAARYKQMTGA